MAALGAVDVLCTHAAPAVPQLSYDVIGGRCKHSEAVLGYLLAHGPRWHYFGDVHQPQAVSWRVGGDALPQRRLLPAHRAGGAPRLTSTSSAWPPATPTAG